MATTPPVVRFLSVCAMRPMLAESFTQRWHTPGSPRAMSAALLASLFAHVLMLASWTSTPPPLRDPSETRPDAYRTSRTAASAATATDASTLLLVQIETAATPKTIQPPRAKHEPKAQPDHPWPAPLASIPSAAVVPIKIVASPQPPQPPVKQGAAGDFQPDINTATVTEQLLATLRLDLARHFYYPPFARQQGWEGKVLLGLRIEMDGSIGNIHVAVSSGHAVLDRSAYSALGKVEKIHDAAQWLEGLPLDLQIPIVYRLREG